MYSSKNLVFGKALKLVLISGFMLLLGTYFYYIFGRNIVLFNFLGIEVERKLDNGSFLMKPFFQNFLCDIFFFIAITYFAKFLKLMRLHHIYIKLLLITPVLMEFGQFFGLIRGTFDIFDLIIYLIVILFNL